jgi:hypothetical protein
MSKIDKNRETERELLSRALFASIKGDAIRPLRGQYAAAKRLWKQGYLTDAGVDVMWPHVLFALTPAGRRKFEDAE